MSYNEPPPPPPQYGAPPPGYGAQPPKNSVMAIIGLVLSIIGVIPCFWGCLIFSVGGAILGFLGKKEVRESNGMKKGENLGQWAFILGLVGIALGILYWILVGADVINFSYDSSFDN